MGGGGGLKSLVSTAVFVGVSFLLPGSAAFTTSLFAKRFVFSYGLSLITKALAPKFKTPNELFAQQEQQDVTSTSTVSSWKIPYGKTITGGQLVYSSVSEYDNNWAHLLVVFSPVEIEGYEALFLNADKVASSEGDPNNMLETDGYVQSEKWFATNGPNLATNDAQISVPDGSAVMFYGWISHGTISGFPTGGAPTLAVTDSGVANTYFFNGKGVRGIYNNDSGSSKNYHVATSKGTSASYGYGWSFITLRNNFQLTDDYKDIAFFSLYDGSSDKGSTSYNQTITNVSPATKNGNEENAYHHMFSDPVVCRELLGRDTATSGRDIANWWVFNFEYIQDWINVGSIYPAYDPIPLSSQFTKGYTTTGLDSSNNEVPDLEHQRAIFKPLAFAHVTIKKDDIYQGGLPNVGAIVKGVKVYDPRESSHSQTNASTWEWSDNPTLCLLDYLTNSEYGCGISYDEIDLDSFIDLANICDEEITYSDSSSVRHNSNTLAFSSGRLQQIGTTGIWEWTKQDVNEIYYPFSVGDRIYFESSNGNLNSNFTYAQPIYVDEFLADGTGFSTSQTGITGGGPFSNQSIRYTRKKYTCNGLVDTDNSMKGNIDNFLSSMAAKLIFVSGKYILIGGDYQAQEGLIDIDDIIGEVTCTKVTPRRDRFNVVKTTFTSAAEDYKPREAVLSKDQTTVNLEGEENVVEIQLPLVTQANQAHHLADITRLRGSYSMVVTMKCNMKVLQYRTGDVVRFTYERWGFVDKIFEIADMSINFGMNQSVDVTLIETGLNIYDHGTGA